MIPLYKVTPFLFYYFFIVSPLSAKTLISDNSDVLNKYDMMSDKGLRLAKLRKPVQRSIASQLDRLKVFKLTNPLVIIDVKKIRWKNHE